MTIIIYDVYAQQTLSSSSLHSCEFKKNFLKVGGTLLSVSLLSVPDYDREKRFKIRIWV